MKKSDIYLWKFVRHLRRTYKNKILALVGIILGIFTMCISNDATVFVFLLIISMCLFFAKDNLTYL